jgi:uncharacterized cupin superfamily protein
MSLFPPMPSLLTKVPVGERSFDLFSVEAATIELEPWDLPTMETEGMEIDGEPARRGRILWRSEDRKSVLMIEELEPCTFRGHHGGELVYMFSGRARAKPGDGRPEYEVGPGYLNWFEAGLFDEWVVEETYRKFLFVAAADELPY